MPAVVVPEGPEAGGDEVVQLLLLGLVHLQVASVNPSGYR